MQYVLTHSLDKRDYQCKICQTVQLDRICNGAMNNIGIGHQCDWSVYIYVRLAIVALTQTTFLSLNS